VEAPLAERPRVVFLLGAGVSVGAGLPKTAELTQMVVVARSTRRPQGRRDEACDRAAERLLAHLTRVAGPEANYEDIYYLLRQIADEGVEYDNPFIREAVAAAAQSALCGSGLPLDRARAGVQP